VNGQLQKHKARLVARGFTQIEGEDYFLTYSPVAKMKSFRLVLALSAFYRLQLTHMDVCSAFLQGELNETLYMQQPEGFKARGREDLVCRLRKPLYGLKQAL
jgi:hypothetical protein